MYAWSGIRAGKDAGHGWASMATISELEVNKPVRVFFMYFLARRHVRNR